MIFTDSRSALYLLNSKKPKTYTELVFKIQGLIQKILRRDYQLHLQWVPSHCQISGNEIADKAAKLGLSNMNIEQHPLPASTLKRLTNKAAVQKWMAATQQLINNNHLGQIRSDLRPHPWSRSRIRRLDTAITRLRIGHCGFKAHLHRLNLEESDSCEWCQQPDTIEHYFFSCPRHFSARTELRSKLQSLNVPFNLTNLLGGGTFVPNTNHTILRHVKVFLRKSERLHQI